MASYERETSVSGGDPDGPNIKISVKILLIVFSCFSHALFLDQSNC